MSKRARIIFMENFFICRLSERVLILILLRTCWLSMKSGQYLLRKAPQIASRALSLPAADFCVASSSASRSLLSNSSTLLLSSTASASLSGARLLASEVAEAPSFHSEPSSSEPLSSCRAPGTRVVSGQSVPDKSELCEKNRSFRTRPTSNCIVIVIALLLLRRLN